MSHSCVVLFCQNIGRHLFPIDETRRALWIAAIQYIKRGRTVKKTSRICSTHFRSSDFIITPLEMLQCSVARRVLKKSAVPCIFTWKPIPQEISLPPEDTFEVTKVEKTYARSVPSVFAEEQPCLDSVCMENELAEDPLQLTVEDTINVKSEVADEMENRVLHTVMIYFDPL